MANYVNMVRYILLIAILTTRKVEPLGVSMNVPEAGKESQHS